MQKNFGEPIIVTANGVHIGAKSEGQQNYLETMRRHVVTFAIGAAGRIIFASRKFGK